MSLRIYFNKTLIIVIVTIIASTGVDTKVSEHDLYVSPIL